MQILKIILYLPNSIMFPVASTLQRRQAAHFVKTAVSSTRALDAEVVFEKLTA
jgi:hypothetical protein